MCQCRSGSDHICCNGKKRSRSDTILDHTDIRAAIIVQIVPVVTLLVGIQDVITAPRQHAVAAAGSTREITIELARIALLERGIRHAVAAGCQFDEMTLTVAVLVGLTVECLAEITLLTECRLHDPVTTVTRRPLATCGTGGTWAPVLRSLITLFTGIENAIAAGRGSDHQLTRDSAIAAGLPVAFAVITGFLGLTDTIAAIIEGDSDRRGRSCG